MKQQLRTAEEKKLEFFVGVWDNSGSVSPGPFGPGGPATGETRYNWDVGGKWLLYISRMELPGLGEYKVHGGVAFNSRIKKYDAFAINNLGNLLVYDGEWIDETTLVFTLVHPRPGSARVIYKKLYNGSIWMISENATEEGKFVPYFEANFVRR
ncbi:MAG: DUF1579 family protein [Candidatus Aminicenantes bacterium]|nr:DUF1579 family protein [Candidatus Aminicenantes bacterium]